MSTAGTDTNVNYVDVTAFSLLLDLHMHFECLIRLTQILVWPQPHTVTPISKRCLPHWVTVMIGVVPCRAFIVHSILTDTESMLERATDYDHTTS